MLWFLMCSDRIVFIVCEQIDIVALKQSILPGTVTFVSQGSRQGAYLKKGLREGLRKTIGVGAWESEIGSIWKGWERVCACQCSSMYPTSLARTA